MAPVQNFHVMLTLAATTVQAANPDQCTSGTDPTLHGSQACCECLSTCDTTYARVATTGSAVFDPSSIRSDDECCNLVNNALSYITSDCSVDQCNANFVLQASASIEKCCSSVNDAATYTFSSCKAATCTTSGNYVHPVSNTCSNCANTFLLDRVVTSTGVPGTNGDTDVCCAKVANIKTYNTADCSIASCNDNFVAQTESSSGTATYKCCSTVSDAATYTFGTCQAATCTTSGNYVHPVSNTCATCTATNQARVVTSTGAVGTNDGTDVCCPKVTNAMTYNAGDCSIVACDTDYVVQTSTSSATRSVSTTTQTCCATVSDAATYTSSTCKAATCTTTGNYVHPASNTCATCTATNQARVVKSTGVAGTHDGTDVCCTKVTDATSYNTDDCTATCGSGKTTVSDGSGNQKCCATSSIVNAVYEYSSCAASCSGKTLITEGKTTGSDGSGNQKCCTTVSGALSYNYADCAAVTSVPTGQPTAQPTDVPLQTTADGAVSTSNAFGGSKSAINEQAKGLLAFFITLCLCCGCCCIVFACCKKKVVGERAYSEQYEMGAAPKEVTTTGGATATYTTTAPTTTTYTTTTTKVVNKEDSFEAFDM